MSWVPDKPRERTWLQKLAARVVKVGPVPQHVAFIMDGNRRFARKNSIDRAEGHLQGFNKLAETLDWCLDLGITEVTVYAFSIENFKRSKDEVDCLMELARQKFARLMQEKELLEKHGVCVRVVGNIRLLPRDIQEIIAEATTLTKNNNRAFLNVCFSYTSRDEMCAAMQEVAEGVQQGMIRESDISERVLEKCLYTNQSKDPDLLIRTSGEVRLSDFLLWQSSFSVLSFMKVLWPEFSLWNLYAGVIYYQTNHNSVQEAKKQNSDEVDQLIQTEDYQCVMAEIEREKANGLGDKNYNVQERMSKYKLEREERIDKFLHHVQHKRTNYLDSLLIDRSKQASIPRTVC